MRDSADSDDYGYGVTRRGNGGKSKRGQWRYDEETYEKRDRHLPKLVAEDEHDATDGLPEGDRWSTWDQSQSPVSNEAGLAERVRDPYSCVVLPVP